MPYRCTVVAVAEPVAVVALAGGGGGPDGGGRGAVTLEEDLSTLSSVGQVHRRIASADDSATMAQHAV